MCKCGSSIYGCGLLEDVVREEQLVELVVMNFYPGILALTAFLNKPRSFNELYKVVSLIEEMMKIAQERQRMDGVWRSGSVSYGSRNASNNSDYFSRRILLHGISK